MSRTPDLDRLLEAVRTVTGSDRDLDTQICLLLLPEAGPCEPHCAGEDPMFWHEPLRKRPPPRLTLRIDSALWLLRHMLPGWGWKVESPGFHLDLPGDEYYAVLKNTARSREARAELLSPRPDDHITRRGVHAPTHYGMTARSEARALLAALLHTLSALEKSHD